MAYRWSSRSLRFAAIAALAAAAGGCSQRYLVKPHQRSYLADRIMRLDVEAQERAADRHVQSTREGAFGGHGTAGGGCGCN